MEENIKRNIAKNLIKYRKSAKLTQLEIAEKLMYSDKNVSKWERGEAIPDVIVLKQLADLYGISVNDFLVEHSQVSVVNSDGKREKRRFMTKKQTLITLLSTSLVWLAAIVCFGLFAIFCSFSVFQPWWLFIISIPLSFVVILVFSSLWCTNLLNSIIVSCLIWSTALACFICINIPQIWLIFMVAIPLQVLDVLWFTLRKINRNLRANRKYEREDV